MKKIIYLIPVFLIFLSTSTAFGFAEMARNNSTDEAVQLTNATQSDQDIQLIQHLIEVDAVRSVDRLYVRETLIFKNIGNENFSGTLRTRVQDDAGDVKIGKTEMMAGAQPVQIAFERDANIPNIVRWSDSIMVNDPLLPLYIVDYFIPAKSDGTLTETKHYSKKIAYPTLINYKYGQRTDLPAIVLKVTKSNDSSVTLQDENMKKIPSQEVTEEGNSMTFFFSTPQFKELNIEISKSAVSSIWGYAGYVILGILILLVFSYPTIRKKSEKLQAFEGKIKNSLKREEEETGEEITEEAVEDEQEEEPLEEEDLSGKSKKELDDEKNETLSRLEELEKDYSSGNLLDEEYEELKGTYKAKIREINKNLKQSR